MKNDEEYIVDKDTNCTPLKINKLFSSSENDVLYQYDNKKNTVNKLDRELEDKVSEIIKIDIKPSLFNPEKVNDFLSSVFKMFDTKLVDEAHKVTTLYFIYSSISIVRKANNNIKLESFSTQMLQESAVFENNHLIGFSGGYFYDSLECCNLLSSVGINENFEKPHLASTYCALSMLYQLKSNLFCKEQFDLIFNSKNNNKEKLFDVNIILNWVKSLQERDGTVRSFESSLENDSRFIYCAFSIREILNKMCLEHLKQVELNKCSCNLHFLNKNEINFDDNSFLNISLTSNYFKSIQSYEGGFAIFPGGESNAGITFCVIASCVIGKIDIPNKEKLFNWLLKRFNEKGVNGRENKVPDSCYSFWVLGSLINFLKIVNKESINSNKGNERHNENNFLTNKNSKFYDFIDMESILNFVLNCYDSSFHAFSKFVKGTKNNKPDILHTYYSLCTMSIITNCEKYKSLCNNTENKFDLIDIDTVLAFPIN